MVISILRIIFCETCVFNIVEATLLAFSILSSGNKMESLASTVLQDRQANRLVCSIVYSYTGTGMQAMAYLFLVIHI